LSFSVEQEVIPIITIRKMDRIEFMFFMRSLSYLKTKIEFQKYQGLFSFSGRPGYFVVIDREASFSPSAVALMLILPGIVSGRIIARQIP
ncbi:MAG: hypothetical protein H6R35_746, partial [Bacteroidetes bacterium]|nr:hypothetical protein [Bacteroidota bacterium]